MRRTGPISAERETLMRWFILAGFKQIRIIEILGCQHLTLKKVCERHGLTMQCGRRYRKQPNAPKVKIKRTFTAPLLPHELDNFPGVRFCETRQSLVFETGGMLYRGKSTATEMSLEAEWLPIRDQVAA